MRESMEGTWKRKAKGKVSHPGIGRLERQQGGDRRVGPK